MSERTTIKLPHKPKFNVSIMIQMPRVMADRIDAYAKKHSLPRAAAVRQLVTAGLDALKR